MPNGLSGFLSGTPQQRQQVPRFSEQQQSALNQLLQRALTGLEQQPKTTEEFVQPIFAQARRGLKEQTIPQLLGDFAASGQLGEGHLAGTLAKASTDLESQLAALQSQIGLSRESGQQQQIGQLLQFGLQPQFETIERPREPGIFERGAAGITEGLSGFGQFLPQLLSGAVGGALGGPAGAAVGSGGVGALIALLKQLLGGGK